MFYSFLYVYQRVPQNPQLFSDNSRFLWVTVGEWLVGAFKRQIRADGSCNMATMAAAQQEVIGW